MTNESKRKGNAFGGKAFIMIPLDLLDAWFSLSHNASRFVIILMKEHGRHRGKQNGRLQATYRQLVSVGITRRLIAPAIREACRSGLVRITRPGGRHLATLYELTWLPSLYAVDPQPKATTGEAA
jgi:hypothetical protein